MIKQCRFSKNISLYIDGELTDEKSAQMRRHIQDCAACSEEFDRLKSVDRIIADIRDVQPSMQFEREFWKKINLVKDKKKKRWSFGEIQFWGLRPSLAAAASVVMVGVGVLLYLEQKPPALSPMDVAIAENLEFYKDYDMVRKLDLLEHWDEIQSIGKQS